MPDKAIVCRVNGRGQEVIGLPCYLGKALITLGPVGDHPGPGIQGILDPDHPVRRGRGRGISLALIPTETARVLEIGRRHFPLNAAS